LLIFQAKTDWEGNFEIVKRNEEKEAEEEEEEDEKRNESKKDGKCVKRKKKRKMRKEMKVRKMGSVLKGRAFMSTSNIHELILEGALGTTEEKGGCRER
jgi:hypothetical protein